MQLNPEQQKAAEFLYGTAVVIAVPGSGKTLTMTQRIYNLIQRHNIAPESILGLTFTRNAANAMRQRLKPLLGEQSERVTLTTLHSFCHSLLRRENRLFELLHGHEQMRFLREILKEQRMKSIAPGMALSEISLAKNHLMTPEEFQVLHEGDPTMKQVAQVYREYEQRKKRKALYDFDDLLLEAYNLLSQNPEVQQRYQETFIHLLVDEFQDINVSQWEIIQLLQDRRNMEASLWVCGDDWQSIYGFNGASLSHILHFQERNPQSQIFILSQNYRSTPQILKVCQNLIRHNQRKIEKTLSTQNETGDEVIVLECAHEEDEALQLVREIQDWVERQVHEYREMAVLYRANFQSRVLEETFSQHEIPYYIQNGTNFYQRREVKSLLDYLQFILTPNSDEGDEALKSILNVPNRYIGRKFLSELEAHSIQHGVSLYRGLQSMHISLPYLRHPVKEFIWLMDPLLQNAESWEPRELLRILRDVLDYDRFVTEEDVVRPDDETVANLDQLELSAARFNDIASFLEYTRTFQDEDRGKNEQGVQCMTIHKAKGLEFPVVFVVGLVEGILPTKRGDTEEERRICFVGISRAMQRLYLSYTQNYLGQPSKKSIFLDEILDTSPPQSSIPPSR